MNYWLQLCTYGNNDMIGMMNRLEIMESINRLNNPGGGLNMFTKTWRF